MKLAARTLADVLGRGGLQRGGQEGRRPSSEGSDKGIDGLLRAVIKGDKDIVKSICQSNRSLVGMFFMFLLSLKLIRMLLVVVVKNSSMLSC